MAAPYRPSSGSSTERTASIVTIVIGVIAVVGVLLVGLITSDDSSANSLPGQQSAPGVPGSDSVGGSGPAVGGGGGVATAVPQAPQAEPSDGAAGTSDAPPSGGGSTGAASDGSDLKTNFPTPPGTKPITSYGSLSHPADEQWFLSTSSLAAVNTYYATDFKSRGAVTYISPSVYRDSSGNPTGYFYIYHFGDTTTVDLSLDANYLDEQSGTVLIRAEVTDD